jgi:hypothetical protein
VGRDRRVTSEPMAGPDRINYLIETLGQVVPEIDTGTQGAIPPTQTPNTSLNR